MRILVTGAFGYLGLALSRALAAAGHRLVAFGHPSRRPALLPEGAAEHHGDLLDDLTSLVAHCDAVVHLAGGGGPARCEADPVAAVRVNVRGTSGLLAAAHAAGVRRLVFASTIQVYGTRRVTTRPYGETDAPAPDDLYGAVKEAAEHMWLAAGGTALRIANVYGAGSGVDLGAQGAVERFARAAAAGGVLTMYGTGAQRIDYVHIDDVVAAFRLAVEAERPLGAVNIGGGAPVSIAELAQACAAAGEAIGKRATITSEPAPDGKTWPDRSLAIDRAAEVLGWRPRVPFARGIAGLVEMMARS